MAWGGLPRRRLDQVRQPMGGGPLGPGTPNTFVGRIVVVYGPTGAVTGVFVYAPGTTPKLGNPPVAWMTESAKDPYGNAVPDPVIGTQDATGNARLNGSAVLVTDTSGGPGAVPGGMSQTPAGVLNLTSGAQALVGDAQATLFVFSKNAGGLGAPGASLDIQMGLYGSSPTGGPQSWQNMALINGWASNAGFGVAQFRPLASPPNSLEVTGAISAAAAASAVFWQIPALYGTPKTAGGRPCGTNTGNNGAASVAQVRWDTLGNLSVASNAALPNGATYFFGFTLPLDAG
jgi:hypothetical protein